MACSSTSSRLPWADKHRPVTLDEVQGNEECVEALRALVHTELLPNVLLAGPCGVGKTTCVGILARERVGQANVLEVNASDNRQASFVSSVLEPFATQPLPRDVPFRVVILDEVDSMDAPAQARLASLLAAPSLTARFALACNDIASVHERVRSFCARFAFRRVSDAHVALRLRTVAEREHIKVTSGALTCLVRLAHGDLRQGLNVLELAAARCDGEITERTVLDNCQDTDVLDVERWLQMCKTGDFQAACSSLQRLMDVGCALEDVIKWALQCLDADFPDAYRERVLSCSQFLTPLQLRALTAELCAIKA